MDNEMFQSIFDSLSKVLPDKWDRVVFRADYTEGSYSMKYYVKTVDGEYVDCYSLPGILRAHIIKIFMDIDKIVSCHRKGLTEKDKWSVLTMTISNDGKFKTDFDYSDISDSSISYHDEWEKKYLRV